MRIKTKIFCILLIFFGFFFSPNPEFFLTAGQKKNELLANKLKVAIIGKIREVFNDYYPLPDMAKMMINFIDQKQKQGEYDQYGDLSAFTAQLTKDLWSVSRDWHIKVWPYEKIPDDLLAEIKLGTPEDNFGFQKVEILPGNLGYINFTSFINTSTAGTAAIAAMNFVSNCDALIIDLRHNGGGDESMATFLSTYFFDKSTHLTDVYIRKDGYTNQVWTQEWVPGKRLTDIPVYILLSRFSYSAAEAFAYQLQQLSRAVIIGEKTRGGAYGVRYMAFKDLSVNLKVPYSQDINPYSKTNYIDGIIPDIEVPSAKAFKVANIQAAEMLLKTESNQEKRYKLEWVISGYQADLNPIVLGEERLKEFTGIYGNDRIVLEGGRLYHQWKDNTRHELVAMCNDKFKYREPEEAHYRIQLLRDPIGAVIEFFEYDSDGDRYSGKKRTEK